MRQSNNPRPFLRRHHTAKSTGKRVPCNLQIKQVISVLAYFFRIQSHQSTYASWSRERKSCLPWATGENEQGKKKEGKGSFEKKVLSQSQQA